VIDQNRLLHRILHRLSPQIAVFPRKLAGCSAPLGGTSIGQTLEKSRVFRFLRPVLPPMSAIDRSARSSDFRRLFKVLSGRDGSEGGRADGSGMAGRVRIASPHLRPSPHPSNLRNIPPTAPATMHSRCNNPRRARFRHRRHQRRYIGSTKFLFSTGQQRLRRLHAAL
jgi:hypothetical protein